MNCARRTRWKDGLQVHVRSRCVRCGHADTIVRNTPFESYPFCNENTMVSEVSACKPTSMLDTASGVSSRRRIGSNSTSVSSVSDSLDFSPCCCKSGSGASWGSWATTLLAPSPRRSSIYPLNFFSFGRAYGLSLVRSARTLARLSSSIVGCRSINFRRGSVESCVGQLKSNLIGPRRRVRRHGQRPSSRWRS